MDENTRIACPKCEWEPDGGKYWACSCGHIWNTFETAAKCPACGKQWKLTQCVRFKGGCGQLSPHEDWYRDLEGLLESELEEVKKAAPAPQP